MCMDSEQGHQIDDMGVNQHRELNEQLQAAGMLGSSQPVAQRFSAGRSLLRNEGYSCVTCGKVYRWKTTLYRHVQVECGKEPHLQCPYCPHRTKRLWDLQKHMKLKHLQENQ